jgi:hypothetical protein
MNITKQAKIFVLVSIITALGTLAFAGSARAGAMDLVTNLASQLGVTENQAAGGAGALLQAAKKSLSEDEYKQVDSGLPGIDSLIEKAPEVSESVAGVSEKVSGGAKGLGSLTKAAGSLGQMAAVKDQFSQLGMDSEMVSKFIPVILEYANTQGGQAVMNLLKGAWN